MKLNEEYDETPLCITPCPICYKDEYRGNQGWICPHNCDGPCDSMMPCPNGCSQEE